MIEERFYTYIYYDPSRDHEPFYVGKGTGGRAYYWKYKNSRVKDRIKKINELGLCLEIGIYGDLDEEFSCFLESELILKFGRRDLKTGSLWNFTDGGESNANRKFSLEHRANIKASKMGKIPSLETRIKMSVAHKGSFRSDEIKTKMSKAQAGKSLSEEHKQNLSKANKGKPISKENLQKRIGKPLSENHRIRLSEISIGKIRGPYKKNPNIKINIVITSCPHCDKSGRSSLMTRYHFDNCKHKRV